jgi:SAM-dependent methyltransferase
LLLGVRAVSPLRDEDAPAQRRELLTRYFSSLAEEGIHPNPANFKFYLGYLFDTLPLEGRAVLDIGAGDGAIGFYARCAGAEPVVCLEPELAGSYAGMQAAFRRMEARHRLSGIRLETTTFQAYDPRGERFDVILLHDSINHLDEEACIALRRDAAARARYASLCAKVARVARPGATLILTDCSRRNVFNMLALTNPLMPRIEWHKHQTPKVWSALLSEAGFGRPRIRRRSPSVLRQAGRVLFGNALGSFLTDSQFCLTMIKK